MLGRWLRTTLVLIIISSCLFSVNAPPFRVRVNGKWTVTLDDKDLLGGPGSGFASPYESTTSEITLTIQNSATTWTCYVSKADTNWIANLPLYIRRTGPGNGGTVSGGSAYQQITDTDQIFFTGSGTPANIPFQLRVDLDLQYLSVDTYDTTVTYTVIED